MAHPVLIAVAPALVEWFLKRKNLKTKKERREYDMEAAKNVVNDRLATPSTAVGATVAGVGALTMNDMLLWVPEEYRMYAAIGMYVVGGILMALKGTEAKKAETKVEKK